MLGLPFADLKGTHPENSMDYIIMQINQQECMKINRNHIWTSRTREAAQVLKKAEVKTTTHTETTEELKAVQTKGDSCDASLLSATATDD